MAFDELPHIPCDDHKWGVGEGVHDNCPIFVRYNISAKDYIGSPKLSLKLGFAIPLMKPSIMGLPDPDENDDLDRIEDLIVKEIGKCCQGVFAMVLSTGKMKEYVFYINKCENIEATHKTIQMQISSHTVQYILVEEPDWKSYRVFSPTN